MKFSAAFALTLGYGISLTNAYPCTPKKFGRLIVFGDSLSDNGNGSWIASDGNWPVDPAYYHHSFSNGPKWNEVTAKDLDLELINLATGGATTDNNFVAGFTGADSKIPVPSTTDQIAHFLSYDKPRPRDVFVHWIGANDILFNATTTAQQVIDLIKINLDKLHASGAKNIIVANYNDVNLFPATYNLADYNTPNAKAYSADLGTGLQKLVQSYSRRARAAFVDVDALFRSMFADPEKFGVDEKYANPPTACLTGVYTSEGVPRHLCSDPERHIFFDAYHPVKEVHARIGKLFDEAIKRWE